MKRGLSALGIALALSWPGDTQAYRPFDSTDAAVADVGVWEIELGALNGSHNDDGPQWSPSLILNYGFAESWEAVLEGRTTLFTRGGWQFSDAAASLKTVFREGSLQDKDGPSLGSELSLLLPGVRSDDGAGLEWMLLASDRKAWGAWHVNIGPELTRDGRGAMVMGAILEGPQDWPLRPVAELRYETTFGGAALFAQLAGFIVPLRDGLALDIAYRHAREGGRPEEQIRAGVTFDLE